MSQVLNIFIIFFVLITIVFAQYDDNDIITLPQGRVQGFFNYRHNYWSFFGIPFASVVGRFDDPGEPPVWSETFKANNGNITCKQFDATTNTVVGVEDCLTLNIYTPAAITEPLPVIVVIFGGGLYKGSNTDNIYNSESLVKKNVVVVTINYRVGAFGFLCLKTKGAPGNAGIKDQIAALRWVKENIASFGGNPDSVTLNGYSVGGNTISLLILTQKAKGLFHKAITSSGNAIRPFYFDRDPIRTAADVATRLGYNTTDPDELLEIFENTSADKIAVVSTRNPNNNAYKQFVFATCVEDINVSKYAILGENPKDLLKTAKDVSDISIITGYDSMDGIFWASNYNSEGLRELDNDFSSAIPKSITFEKEEYKRLLIKDIREFYFNNSLTTITGLVDYFSDVLVHYPSLLVSKAFLTNPRISLYNFYFNYRGDRNYYLLKSPLRDLPGASHCDEVGYLFNPIEYRDTTPTPEDARIIDVMTSLWTSFARTGRPTSNSTCENFIWMRSENYLKFFEISNRIDSEIEMIMLPNLDRMDFWKRAQERYGIEYF